MKTTVEIADPLFRAAQRLARERNLTMRAIVEDGVRRVLAQPDAAVRYVVPATVVTGSRPSRWDALAPEDRLEVMYGDRS